MSNQSLFQVPTGELRQPVRGRPRRRTQEAAERARMGATLVTLLDRGYFLPGSLSVLARSGVRGLTTISVENVTFPTARTIKIQFTGKNFTSWYFRSPCSIDASVASVVSISVPSG